MIRGKAGVTTATLSGAISLGDNDTIFQRLNPNGSNRNVTVIPQAKGRGFVIVNTGTSGNLAILDKDASAVVTLAPGESAIIAGTGTGLVSIAVDTAGEASLTDGTATLSLASGSLSEAGLVNASLTASGTMTMEGGGVSLFGDDVGKLRFDGAGAASWTGVTSHALTASGALDLAVGSITASTNPTVGLGTGKTTVGSLGIGADVDLTRQAANVAELGSGDSLFSVGTASIGRKALTGDANATCEINANGISFGAGGASAPDVAIVRSAPNVVGVAAGKTIATDTIAEVTGAAGVTIDGVTLKDDGILSLVLADHADDAAAAAGGIAVGQLYRTASAVKVRVA